MIKELIFLKKFNTTNLFNTKRKIKYSFTLVSLLSPHSVLNTRLLFQNINKNEKKNYVKQSYLLFTWFFYLNFLNSNEKTRSINFHVLPIKKKKYTIVRAPMAHKNWSKEQLKFQFYKFKISFHTILKENNHLSSLNQSLFFIILSKKSFPTFETNLLFLKNYWFLIYTEDSNFFSFSNFKSN